MADGVLYEGSDKREHVCAPSHGRVYYARVPRLLMREPLLGGREGKEGGSVRVRLCCRELWKGRVVAS